MQPLSANQRVGMNVALHRGDMSQADLAKRLAAEIGRDSVDPTTITRLEQGKRPTTVNELDALSRIFGVSTDELLADPAIANDINEFRQAVQTTLEAFGRLKSAHDAFVVARRELFELRKLTPEAEPLVGVPIELIDRLTSRSVGELLAGTDDPAT